MSASTARRWPIAWRWWSRALRPRPDSASLPANRSWNWSIGTRKNTAERSTHERPPMQIVIPMSGFGERFRRAGYDIPKPLIEVEGKPIVAHVVDMFPGETDFIFI